MKDNQNITILVLAVTATILAAMLLAGGGFTPRAQAEASVKQGDYLMLNGSISSGTDLVYVIDIATRRLNVYGANRAQANTRQIELVDWVDLEKAFAE